MINYGYVQNDQVLKIGLPKVWTNKTGCDVSGFDLMDEESLRSEDWYPIVDERPDYDPSTQYPQHYGYTFEADHIKAQYNIFDIPVPVIDMAALKSESLKRLNEVTSFALTRMPYKGIIIELGAKVDTNMEKFRKMVGMIPDRSIVWRALDGTFGPDDPYSFIVTMEDRPEIPDSVTVDQLEIDIAMYEAGVYAWKDTKILAIRAATTPEELNAIVMEVFA